MERMSVAAVDFERYCRGCRHLLRGVVSGRCPECGRGFDRDDLRTTAAHPHGEFWEFVRQFVRTQLAIAVVVAAVIFLGSAFGRYLLVPLVLAFSAALLFVPTLLVAAVVPKIPLARKERIGGVALVAVLISVLYTQWP